MNEKILELLEAKKYSEIGALLKDMNPADAAVMLEELPEQKMPICVPSALKGTCGRYLCLYGW